jgi:predicted membrane metal-binding protein
MTPISQLEAELVLRRSNRLSQATSEITQLPKRFSAALVWMVPSILMISFGEALTKSFGISVSGTLMLLVSVTGAMALGHEAYLLQRKVTALTEVVLALKRDDGSSVI